MMNTTVATASAPRVVDRAPRMHQIDPLVAQALLSVWSGDPALVIDSPPGAGKTRLITHLAYELATRGQMRVAIAAQTRAQAYDVAARVGATGARTVFADSRGAARPEGLAASVIHVPRDRMGADAGVYVATSAGWQWTQTSWRADVLLCDEAYQMTWATLCSLGALADRFVLVGDPGQIAPVVTGSTRRWERHEVAPHVPAPSALRAAYADKVALMRLPRTWRLGPATTRLIGPLYPELAFESARPDRHLSVGSRVLGEYAARPVTVTGGPSDVVLAQAAADTAMDLLSGAAHDASGARPLTGADIAVVTPHVDQATAVAAMLACEPDVFVGTINQAQGLEREAVVAVHPLAGHTDAEDFATDLGRLCVALSRHRAHLTVITDTHTPTVLARATREGNTTATTHTAILNDLLAATP